MGSLRSVALSFIALSIILSKPRGIVGSVEKMGVTDTLEPTSTEWGKVPKRPRNDDTAAILGDTCQDEEEFVEVAVIGGGLAGLAVAIGLHRANIPFRLYERAPALRDASQGGLSVWSNGMAALGRIHPSLPKKVAEAGAVWEGSTATDLFVDGTMTSKHSNASAMKEKEGMDSVLIAWHELQRALASMLPADSVATSKSLVKFEEEDQDGSVVLYFEDRKRVRCRAALACDGVFSAARKVICPKDDDKPVFFGHMNWNAIVPTSYLPEGSHAPNSVQVVRSHAEPRWFAYMLDAGQNRTFFSCRVEDGEKALSVSGSHGRGGLGLKGVKERLLPIVSNHPQVHDALEAIPESEIFERSIVVRVPAWTWISPRGRVALVGDAAHGMHPIIGQGGNSAFESAAAAVDALTKCGGDYLVGLSEYEKNRKPRADFVNQLSNFVGLSWGPSSPKMPADISRVSNDYARSVKGYNQPPPTEAVETMEQFDLLSQDGAELVSW